MATDVASLFVLTDYRGAFYSSTTNAATACTMDVDRLICCFAGLGVTAVSIPIAKIDLTQDWNSRIVLYQSAEDPDLLYRSYIEDTVLALSLAGARLVPDFPFLRAHHNKTFLSMLCQLKGGLAATLWTRTFGVLEDFDPHQIEYPAVLKLSAGAGSTQVHLLSSAQQATSLVERLTRSAQWTWTLKEWLKSILRNGYIPYSSHRRKFMIQQFLPNLVGDYKVLVFGEHFFVVHRRVRDRDFRASGSGLISWPEEPPAGLLDFAEQLLKLLDVAYASFDVAVSANGRFHLIEAQFVCFGPLALEKAPFHWRRQDAHWLRVSTQAELEATLASAVAQYICRKGWTNVEVR